MKTSYNEKMTLKALNEKGDKKKYAFNNRVIRTKLIAEKYYNPSTHKKGKFYITSENNGKTVMLWAAYDLKGGYAPMIGFDRLR